MVLAETHRVARRRAQQRALTSTSPEARARPFRRIGLKCDTPYEKLGRTWERGDVDQLWVAELRISQRIAQKIREYHWIEPQEVCDAVVAQSGLVFRRLADPEKVIIRTAIRRRPVLVVMYPTSDPMGDVWRLASAYFDD